MSGYFYGQAVERRSDTTRELRFQLGVAGAVGEMSEPGLTRTNLLCGCHCFRYAEVRRMLSPEERIQHENVNAAKCVHRFVGQLLGVGDVAQVRNAISVNRHRPVRDRDGKNIDVSNAK